MTTLVCDFSDVLGTPMPDGIARVTSGEVRPGLSTPSVIVPRIHEQPLVGGSATFPQVEPGNIVIHLIWGAQNTTIRTLVPDQETVTLSDCLQFQYTIPSDIETARQLAITAQQAATAAASSATAANNSRASAASSATAASQSAVAASTSATNAATSAGEASTHEDNSLDAAAAAIAAAVSVAQFQGHGFPNGVVAAPVGSIYTDLDATAGAIRWIKEAGAGSTGWRVDYGDTGWRRLDALIVAENFAAGSLIARRRGGTVEVVGYNLRAYVTSEDLKALLTLPQGFLPTYTARYGSTYWGMRWNIAPQGLISLGQLMVDDYFSVLYTSQTDWPTTLPGTPA